MLRAILSVIVGYIVMCVFVFGSFTAAMFVLGVDRTYKPGVWDVSVTWIVISSVLGLIAALLGGLVSAVIAETAKPPRVLALIVLILGALMAVPALFMKSEAPPARTADVSPLEAMQYSQTPPVAALLNPIIGCVGVLIGARLIKKNAPSSPA